MRVASQRRSRHVGLIVALGWLAGCGDEAVERGDAADASATEDTAATASEDAATTAPEDTAATALEDAAAGTDGDAFVPSDSDATFGGERPAKVVLPLAYDPAQAWPLVLLLHGYGVDGEIQDLYLGFSAAAAEAGFLTIVPDGTQNLAGQRFWNTSPGWCCDFGQSGVDDAGYLVGLVVEASRRWHVDPARVFAFGHSNGGFMAHKLACAHAERFAAIGALAGSLPADGAACTPARPVSVLQVHGTLDATIVYPGNADYPGAEEVATRWASYDLCAAEPVSGAAFDYDSAALGAETSTRTWSGCDDDVEVALWTLAGSGHIPGFDASFSQAVLAWLAAHGR